MKLVSYIFPLSLIVLTTGCFEIRAQKVLAEEQFTIDQVKTLQVDGRFCNIELKGTAGTSLKMDGYIKGSGNPDNYEIKYERRGDRVEVWVDAPSSIWGNIESRIRFEVPVNVDIEVDNSSGNLKMDQISTRQIDLETSSGNIEAENSEADLLIRCTSGNVSVEDHLGNLSVTTTSGNIKIRDSMGDTELKATSGNINLDNLTGSLYARCSSGNITMNQIKGKLNTETSSGNIKGDEVLLNGDSEFRATSGNIRIDLLNREDDLSFDLEAGSGNLRAAGSSGEDNLILKRGGISITGISSSGNQTYTTR
jgi:DUF4097 and DUF4098 domain-containing protein YvlB